MQLGNAIDKWEYRTRDLSRIYLLAFTRGKGKGREWMKPDQRVYIHPSHHALSSIGPNMIEYFEAYIHVYVYVYVLVPKESAIIMDLMSITSPSHLRKCLIDHSLSSSSIIFWEEKNGLNIFQFHRWPVNLLGNKVLFHVSTTATKASPLLSAGISFHERPRADE